MTEPKNEGQEPEMPEVSDTDLGLSDEEAEAELTAPEGEDGEFVAEVNTYG